MSDVDDLVAALVLGDPNETVPTDPGAANPRNEATMDDDYWSKPCTGCGNVHTNLECVTQVAENVGMSLEEAKRIFIPQAHAPSVAVSDAWTNWTSKAKPEDIQ